MDYLLGGALLARKSVLETVGLFDPGYIGYWYEETDLSVRVKMGGFRILINPFAKVWHQPHKTEEHYSFRKKYLSNRNAIRFMKKYANGFQWTKYAFFVIGSIPLAVIRDLIRSGSLAGIWGKLRGLYDGLRGYDRYALELTNSGSMTWKTGSS